MGHRPRAPRVGPGGAIVKQKLILVVVALVLFAGSLVGLLAARGRLNYEGTRGVPVVSMFFSAPGADAGHGSAGKDTGKQAGKTEPGHGNDAAAATAPSGDRLAAREGREPTGPGRAEDATQGGDPAR